MVESVVVVRQPILCDVQRSLVRPLANVDSHVDCPKESYHPTGGFSLESIGEHSEEVILGILQISHGVGELLLSASLDQILEFLVFKSITAWISSGSSRPVRMAQISWISARADSHSGLFRLIFVRSCTKRTSSGEEYAIDSAETGPSPCP